MLRQTPGIILGVIYHPFPPQPNQSMINHLQEMLDKLYSIHPDALLLLVGDFNRLLEKFLLQSPPFQLVKHPTREERILDKIFTNKVYLFFSPDHKALLGRCDHHVSLRAWHSNNVLLCKKRRNKVQRISKMLQEKYYAKQRLKIQQTGCKKWWKITSKLLELNKPQHTLDNILIFFNHYLNFFKMSSSILSVFRIIWIHYQLNLHAKTIVCLFDNTIPLQLSPDIVWHKFRKIICD